MNKKQNKTEQKHSVKTPVRCLHCLHASLHRYDSNPILAACHQKPQADNERFPFEVEIANVLRQCAKYDYDHNDKPVEQRTKQHIA